MPETLNDEITSKLVAKWSKLDPEGWATESYILAMKYAYKVSVNDKLSKAYIERLQNIIDERL